MSRDVQTFSEYQYEYSLNSTFEFIIMQVQINVNRSASSRIKFGVFFLSVLDSVVSHELQTIYRKSMR